MRTRFRTVRGNTSAGGRNRHRSEPDYGNSGSASDREHPMKKTLFLVGDWRCCEPDLHPNGCSQTPAKPDPQAVRKAAIETLTELGAKITVSSMDGDQPIYIVKTPDWCISKIFALGSANRPHADYGCRRRTSCSWIVWGACGWKRPR